MTGARPSYKIDCNKPGSDVAAETAASFASAAILASAASGVRSLVCASDRSF